MCGITGYYSSDNKIKLSDFYKAHLLIKHRGPDDEGFVSILNDTLISLKGDDTINYFDYLDHVNNFESNLVLGHRRLSIIDLSEKGHQPLSYDNLSLVFNGEIFNYIEIKELLLDQGYSFKTDSDTEVFLIAYHAYGDDCFNMFNGMWSAAIYDNDKRSLKLVRDRYGIKPLYYYHKDGSIYFSSEVKFILEFISNVKSNINMVFDYIEHSKIWHTSETMFSEIHQVNPGEILVYDGSNVSIDSYYSLTSSSIKVKDSLHDLVYNSVKLRMRSDVQVGSMLSGGIDSTIISCIAAEMTSNLNTFTITNTDFDPEKKYVEETLQFKKFDSHEINVSYDSFSAEELIQTIEFPFKSFTVPAQRKLFEYVKKNTDVKVLLSGEGADEVFSGYNIHPYIFVISLIQEFKFFNALKELTCISYKNKSNLISTSIELIKTYFSISKNVLIQKLKGYYNNRKSHFKTNRSQNILKKCYKNLFTDYLFDSITKSSLREYLMYSDLNSMSQSIEVRVPFMDFKLIEAGFNIENSERVKKAIPKQPLRKSFRKVIPELVIDRKDKKGFYTPYEKWIKVNLIPQLDNLFYNLNDENKFSYFNYKKFLKNYELFKQGKGSKDYTFFWRVYLLHKWKSTWKIID